MRDATSTAAASETPKDPDPSPETAEKRTSPIELLWDLVFVFAIT